MQGLRRDRGRLLTATRARLQPRPPRLRRQPALIDPPMLQTLVAAGAAVGVAVWPGWAVGMSSCPSA